MNRRSLVANPIEAAVQLYSAVKDIVTREVIPQATAKRTGGWFAVWCRNAIHRKMEPMFGFAVGSVSTKRFLKYQFFANEKALRLSGRPVHISSWQIRDTDFRDTSFTDPLARKYAGAIWCDGNDVIFSFSGFSELEDEWISTAIAYRFRLISDKQVGLIIEASHNEQLAVYFAHHRHVIHML